MFLTVALIVLVVALTALASRRGPEITPVRVVDTGPGSGSHPVVQIDRISSRCGYTVPKSTGKA